MSKEYSDKKKKSRVCLLFFISILTVILLFYNEIRAMVLMSWWNQVQMKDSLLSDCGLDIQIPGGLVTTESDWFPFVMNYNADKNFEEYTGQPGSRLTVLYNFPAYSLKRGCSKLYDPSSPFYNSFYGAYLVRSADGHPYGFSYGTEADPKSISIIPRFDYQELVLKDFGLKNDQFLFQWTVTKKESGITYLKYDNWTVFDADLLVSGAVHKAKNGVFSYNQYGRPADYHCRDFKEARMKGKVYARYFPENDVSVFFYIVASDPDTVKKCDEKILSKSRIRKKRMTPST